jgi:alkaline phosphatase
MKLTKPLLASLGAGLLMQSAAMAQTVYPIHRASILSGQMFDFKVEFSGVVDPAKLSVQINGVDHAEFFGQGATLTLREDGVDASAVRLNNVRIMQPGKYVVTATDGQGTASVTWEVYGTPSVRQAKNVILFVADGLSPAHRTAARVMSKGITEGKYHGELAMDSMPHMAMVGTSGVDSIITDSANSAHAYTTGHKSSVNALGVYADRTPDTFDDPKVETIAELVKRRLNMAVGVVSDAEIQDATPASVVAHTRRRAEKAAITGMFFNTQPEVILGGGSAYFLPQSTPGSKRKDEQNFFRKFQQEANYAIVTERDALMAKVEDPATRKVLGMFSTGNMDGVLDREFYNNDVKFPNQPDLIEMTEAAIKVLDRHEDGFFLMVEAAMVDKYSHPLDWERAVMDTIMFDKAVAVAKQYAAMNGDTLVLVTGDHTHGLSIIGTVDDSKPGDLRDQIGVYADAGYPNYVDGDGDGYPDDLNVSKRLAVVFSNFPDHYETLRPKQDGTFSPAVRKDKVYVANEKYKNEPGAIYREGILPRSSGSGVHTADDMILSAMGPGAEQVRGFMDNTEIFRVMAEALSLGVSGMARQAEVKPVYASN